MMGMKTALILGSIFIGSFVILGAFYYVMWGYLPWWPKSEHYDHRH